MPHLSSRPDSSVGLPENVSGTQDVEAFGPRALDLPAASQGAGYGNPSAALSDQPGAWCEVEEVAAGNSLLEPWSPDGWLNAMADRFPNGSINIFDREMRYVFAEGEGLRAVGLSAGALVGKRLADIFSAESVAYVEPFYRRAFLGESVRFELRIFDRLYYIAAGPMTTEGSSVTRIIAVAQDITDTKAPEAGIAWEQAARGIADRSNRVRDELLSVVSHELRTPINAILGWSELLLKTPTGSVASQAVAAIRRSASHQSRLIEDLLDSSQIATGTIRLTTGHVRIRELLMAVVEMVLPQAVTKGVRLECRYTNESDAADGDRDRLQQVFSNILINGIKFTPAGGSVIVEGHATADGVEVRVADTGIGISPEFLPSVFERFVKMERFSHEGAGLGLGLALAKDIVTAHGGVITAHSDGIGHGTTMTVRLPRLPVDLASG